MKKYLIIILAAAVALAVVLIPDRVKEKPHPPVPARPHQNRPRTENVTVEKAEGGRTIAEIYAGKADLAGKTVLVRGKVVRYTPGVMGKNWIHIQDGTGTEGTNDLTVTTSAVVKIGDTITVRGLVETDKDFGLGYAYEILIQDAEVTVE